MDNREYRDNQKKQKKAFSGFRKYIKRAFIWAGISVASAFLMPWSLLMPVLKIPFSPLIAGSITFFAQWGITAVGAIGAVINGLKARHAAKTVDKAQQEEENIVDCMVLEGDKLERKVENLSKSKELENDKTKEAAEIEMTKSSQVNTVSNKPTFTVLKGNMEDEENKEKQLKKAS